MLGYVFSGIIILSIICGFFTGNVSQITDSVFAGAENAVMLTISLCGTICFFSGIMEIADKSGIVKWLTKLLTPLLKCIFTNFDENSKTANAISMNLVANMLGLGNAATPFGLKAMQLMNENNNSLDKTATDNMIVFVMMNTVSLQIIPTTIALLRHKYGADNPLNIMPCVWIASSVAVFVGIILSKLFARLYPINKEV